MIYAQGYQTYNEQTLRHNFCLPRKLFQSSTKRVESKIHVGEYVQHFLIDMRICVYPKLFYVKQTIS